MNQLIVGAIVIAAALFVMSVIRLPESGGDTAGNLVSVLEVSQDISNEGADFSTDIINEEVSDENTDSPSEAPDESVESPSEVPGESVDSSVEALQENMPDTVESILENAQSANWTEDVPQLTYSFRNDRLLNQHYEKHGIEMGFATIEEYVAAANAVINHPDVLHKLEAEDNDDVYFLEATNEFVVVSTDGYIRTYFIASGGIDYYNRQ